MAKVRPAITGVVSVVEVVAVERQARLEPQRIARAEADRLGQLVRDDRVGELGRGDRRHRNLEPVLAGIARAADPQAAALPVERPALHEAELADAGNDRLEHLGGARALEREQRLLLHMVDDDVAGQAALA